MIKIQEYKETRYEIIGGYATVIILILFSSFSSTYFLDNLTYDYIALAIVILAYLFRYKSIPHIYYKIFLVFSIYNVIHLLIYHDIHPSFFARYLFYISLPFFVIRFNFDNFFERLEKVVYYGALISLPIYILQIIAFSPVYNSLSALQQLLGITSPPQHDGLYYANTFFYTINTTDHFRNCGFMFEPGAFGSILAVAVGLNLIHNNFNLKNKRLIVLIVAIVSTQSTTAFLALVCVILFYLVNKGSKKGIILIPVGLAIIFLLFQLPFMSKKITDLATNPNKQLNKAVALSNDTQRAQSLGRFAGLLLNFEDFKKAPIFGIGGHDEMTEKLRQNWEVNSVNGLGSYLVTFGLAGILLLIYNLDRSFKNLTSEYDMKGHYNLILMFLVISFSFLLIETPLFFSFQIYYLARVKIVSESELSLITKDLSYLAH